MTKKTKRKEREARRAQAARARHGAVDEVEARAPRPRANPPPSVQARPAPAGRGRAAAAAVADLPPRLRRLLAWPPELTLRRITAVALLATLALVIIFAIHDQQLSPYSIVSLELAGTPERALEMFTAWGVIGQQAARQSLLIDLAFMPAYAVLFAGLLVITARGVSGRWQKAGLYLVLAPFAAWALDLVENAALWQALAQPASPPASALAVAGVAATLKFGLLLACLIYLLAALLRRRLGRR